MAKLDLTGVNVSNVLKDKGQANVNLKIADKSAERMKDNQASPKRQIGNGKFDMDKLNKFMNKNFENPG